MSSGPCSGSRSAASPRAKAPWPFDPPERTVTCSACGQQTAKYTTTFPVGGDPVTTCFVCENPRHSTLSGHSGGLATDLTLEHVTDEFGRPVHVSSLRQLREAEKRYHFRHHAANHDEANWNSPPQAPSGSIQDNVKWLYPELSERMLKDPEIQADMKRDREMILKKMA